MINAVEKDESLFFSAKVIPRSSQTEIAGEHDGALKVKLSAPPIDGAANTELIRLLAKTFGVSKTNVEIIKGQSSRSKKVKITGLSCEEFYRIFKS